jgi:hypothetical protein
VPPFTR